MTVREARIEEAIYQERLDTIPESILDIALKKPDLKDFLDEIVKIGSDLTHSKSCSIFLLEEGKYRKGRGRRSKINVNDGKILRIYAASGDVGEKLLENNASYYIPYRIPFKDPGHGKKLVLDIFRKCPEFKKNKINEILDQSRKSGITLKQILDDHGVNQDQFIDKIENGELPMGITAWALKMGQATGTKLYLDKIMNHPEWRGSYEGAHEICTSVIEIPLISESRILGLIKIENHKDSDSVTEFRKLSSANIFRFTEKHEKILNILSGCVVQSIQNVIFRETETYKTIFGTQILREIKKLDPGNDDTNIAIHKNIVEFYDDKLKIDINDISGIEKIYKNTSQLIKKISSDIDLEETNKFIIDIGPVYEPVLATVGNIRDHFIHQFQVFLLGYYLINTNEKLKADCEKKFSFDQILKIWYTSSIFHDYGYSISVIEKWLNNYFENVKIPRNFSMDWNKLFNYFEEEKFLLTDFISDRSSRPKNEIVNKIKDDFLNEQHDHGVIFSLIFLKILQNSKLTKEQLLEGACAISLHSSPIKGLIINQFPIAFLLYFCDNSQEWGRPKLKTWDIGESAKLKEIQIRNEETEIKLVYAKAPQSKQVEIQSIIEGINDKWKFSRGNSYKFFTSFYVDGEKESFATLKFSSN